MTVVTTDDQNYSYPGASIDMKQWNEYASFIVNESFKSSGFGTTNKLVTNFLSKLDKNRKAIVPASAANYGYTFITRPRLNMSSGNLRQHPVMSSLASTDSTSIPFMIRMLLDTKLSRREKIAYEEEYKYYGASGDKRYDQLIGMVSTELDDLSELAKNSPMIDVNNPFFTPLCNGLRGISGWPDLILNEETTEGDFHSGDFTFIKGSDFNNRTNELSLEFIDMHGSVILSIIYYWCMAMALQAKGVIMAYQDDIYLQRLNYTVSIYRFITDHTRKNILWWSKATGCFPKMAPIGALFNMAQEEVSIGASFKFSVPFVANDIKYCDPDILSDFNLLVGKYNKEIINSDQFLEVPGYGAEIDDKSRDGTLQSRWNFVGIPYIAGLRDGTFRLTWRAPKKEIEDNLGKDLDKVLKAMETKYFTQKPLPSLESFKYLDRTRPK